MELSTSRLRIRTPTNKDAYLILEFYIKNKIHLEQWEPVRTDEFYTEQYWQSKIAEAQNNLQNDRAYFFLFFLKDSERLIGIINLCNIERASFQNGRLGYKIAADHEGRGLMREGLAEVVRFAFEDLNLRRLEANVIPSNERSLRLLKRLGFVIIGRDDNYLVINGIESPHLLTSLVKKNWKKTG